MELRAWTRHICAGNNTPFRINRETELPRVGRSLPLDPGTDLRRRRGGQVGHRLAQAPEMCRGLQNEMPDYRRPRDGHSDASGTFQVSKA